MCFLEFLDWWRILDPVLHFRVIMWGYTSPHLPTWDISSIWTRLLEQILQIFHVLPQSDRFAHASRFQLNEASHQTSERWLPSSIPMLVDQKLLLRLTILQEFPQSCIFSVDFAPDHMSHISSSVSSIEKSWAAWCFKAFNVCKANREIAVNDWEWWRLSGCTVHPSKFYFSMKDYFESISSQRCKTAALVSPH